MKKTLREQLGAAASKYASKHPGHVATAADAFAAGAEWMQKAMARPLAAYAKDLRRAIETRTGAVEPFLKLQIQKTAQLWMMVDRLTDELADAESTMMTEQGSQGQTKQTLDPRVAQLEKYHRTLTADLTALGLNFQATPSKVREETKKGLANTDPLAVALAQNRAALADIGDVTDPSAPEAAGSPSASADGADRAPAAQP